MYVTEYVKNSYADAGWMYTPVCDDISYLLSTSTVSALYLYSFTDSYYADLTKCNKVKAFCRGQLKLWNAQFFLFTSQGENKIVHTMC